MDSRAVRDLCERHHIEQMMVFGSVLRDDFRPDSDVDLVIRVEEGFRMTFRELGEVERDLSELAGRPVDIVLSTELDAPEANPYRKRNITEKMELLYVR